MPIVFSDELPVDAATREWWYNSLDCAVTLEVHHALEAEYGDRASLIYDFERSLQGPALDMMLRGFKIDPVWRANNITLLERRQGHVQELLNRLAHSVWGRDLNPRSPVQVKEFFYDHLRLPPVYISQKGERKLSANREALEKLTAYYIAQPFISCIFSLRDIGKKLGTMRSGIGADGRMRCTYNVCGTETGRWASSRSVWGDGTNLQNITDELRRAFIADPGYILLYVDGEQAESRSTGFIHGRLFGDWRYLDLCESGDLHTNVTKLVWPDKGWTGDPKADREIADGVFYRWFTFRDMSKRGGHATNYYGKPWTVAKHLKVPQTLIESFQAKYVPQFAFQKWWTWVSAQLTTKQSITTFLGRERTFFSRPNDDSTLREAIAYEPQSTVGDIVNEGGKRIWRNFPEAQVLAQIHDAYLFQIPEDRLDLIEPICKTFEVPVTHKTRTMVIPAEAKVGWNWASEDPKKKIFADGNPDGLRKWKGSDSRKRTESPETSLLDRVLY